MLIGRPRFLLCAGVLPIGDFGAISRGPVAIIALALWLVVAPRRLALLLRHGDEVSRTEGMRKQMVEYVCFFCVWRSDQLFYSCCALALPSADCF